jgi:oligopeptide/dipeptide ABC transporter ATP-binding protein
MYLGGIVETGPTTQLFADPRHPFTRALLSAAPVARWAVKRTRTRLSGEIASAIDPPDACRLAGRCPVAQPSCFAARPPLLEIGDGRAVACPIVIERTSTC